MATIVPQNSASDFNAPFQADEFSYSEAFKRNLGLINPDEQVVLRDARVAIAGMGGVGGIDLVTLARLGVGRFTIADPEVYDVVNINRQFGATHSTIGRSKAEVMAEIVRDINPEAQIRVLPGPVEEANVDEFLRDADLFVDALEFFEMDVRRLLFRRAASLGIHAITAGPVGFSAIWIVFSPEGMSFDRYFDLSDDMDKIDKLVAFGVGVAPKATQRSYMDLRYIDTNARVAPSVCPACHLAAGAVAAETVKILLKRGRVRVAPYFCQFDPYLGRLARGRLRGGNRHPWQRLKRWWLARQFRPRLNQEDSIEC